MGSGCSVSLRARVVSPSPASPVTTRRRNLYDDDSDNAGDSHYIRTEFGAQASTVVRSRHKLTINLKGGEQQEAGEEAPSSSSSSSSLAASHSKWQTSSSSPDDLGDLEDHEDDDEDEDEDEVGFGDDPSRAPPPTPPTYVNTTTAAATTSTATPPKASSLNLKMFRFFRRSTGTRGSNNHRTSPTSAVPRKALGLVGLTNLGNTCFLNSALQCLSNTVPLAEHFLESNWKSRINYNNPIGFKGKIAQAFGALISEMWTADCRSPVINSLTSFKRELGKVRPQFSGYDQHDSQELIIFLLDGLHEDLNQVVTKPYVEDIEYDGKGGEDEAVFAKRAWQGHLLRNQSIIVDISQGQLKSTLTCSKCGHKSIKYEPFMYLSLPVPHHQHRRRGKEITLQMCLEEFCKEEELNGYCQWYCGKCKEHVDATKQLTIWSLPDILIVHLKRFEQEGLYRRSKINALVEFPTRNLDLSSMLAPASAADQGRGTLYDLYAVSNHHGGLNGGHYTASGRNKMDHKWYKFNDSSFCEMREEDACSASAYVLFYQKNKSTRNPSCALTPNLQPPLFSSDPKAFLGGGPDKPAASASATTTSSLSSNPPSSSSAAALEFFQPVTDFFSIFSFSGRDKDRDKDKDKDKDEDKDGSGWQGKHLDSTPTTNSSTGTGSTKSISTAGTT